MAILDSTLLSKTWSSFRPSRTETAHKSKHGVEQVKNLLGNWERGIIWVTSRLGSDQQGRWGGGGGGGAVIDILIKDKAFVEKSSIAQIKFVV